MSVCTWTDISAQVGSVGGVTYQKTKGGYIRRTKPIPTNPNTPRQQQTRSILATHSAGWSSVLTQVQRDAWDDYAVNHPVVGKMGRNIWLTGHQWYLKCNCRLTDAELSLIALPPIAQAPPSIIGLAVTLETPDAIEVAFTTALEAGHVLVAWATPPKHVGSSPNFDQASLVGYSDADAVTPIEFTSPWNLQVDHEMYVYVAQMSPEGLLSAFEVDSALAAAPV